MKISNNLLKSITAAAKLSDMTTTVRTKKNISRPRYDSECKMSKKNLKILLKKCKGKNFSPFILQKYSQSKNHKLIVKKKVDYKKIITDKIASTKDSKQFKY